MKKTLTLTLFFLFSLAGFTQFQAGKISGTVIDGNARTIESATITLLKAGDSTVAKMAVASKTGLFQFEGVPEGRFLVSVSALGHKKAWSEIITINSNSPAITIKTIELEAATKDLAAVTVVAKKPLIEQKVDRTIVNVEASITNVGSSALEVLEKSPGVSVDKDGNISLKGKQGVVVMIDGRPSYLSGQDLANMLRGMNSSQLDKIEIMTNPPAKYDAAGNSGVINIMTKKNKQFGYNGSVTSGYTQGHYARFNESMNFNYRNGKWNLFTSAGYNKNRRTESLIIDRNFRESTTKDLLSIFKQSSIMGNESKYFNAKLGVDYFATKRTTLGLVFSGFENPSVWNSRTSTWIFTPDNTLQSQTRAVTKNDSKWKNFSGNFNLRSRLDSAGQEITADLDFVNYNSTSKQPFYSYYYDNAGNLLRNPDTLMGNLPQDITIYSGKMDYTLPIKNNAKFEAGIKTSYVKTDNDANYDSIRDGTIHHDFNRSNHFLYEENINAAYLNYSRPLGKKWNGQFGLRMENTNAKGNQLSTNIRFRRNYTQLFPTVYLQYAANEKNQFVINYGRRINRPDYEDLNPFIQFLDRYTFEKGNPDLRPQFSHNIELSHTYKGFLTSTINYSRTTDIIQQVIEQNELSNETFIKKANIASRDQFGFTVTANKQFKKWWSGNIYLNIADNKFKGIVNNDPISLSIFGFMGQVQQQFNWSKGWGAELSAFYRTKGLEGVIFIKSIAQVNAGFSKQIMKNKGSLKLNVRDIFHGGVFKGYSRYGTVDAQFVNINDSRTVSVAFTYRFNKGKLKANAGRKEGSASDEQGRVKAGN